MSPPEGLAGGPGQAGDTPGFYENVVIAVDILKAGSRPWLLRVDEHGNVYPEYQFLAATGEQTDVDQFLFLDTERGQRVTLYLVSADPDLDTFYSANEGKSIGHSLSPGGTHVILATRSATCCRA